MAALKNITVGAGDEGLRLDRWFKTHYPTVGHGELQKLLRTGQVRVDGKRAKAGLRLCQGMEVRVPPQVRSPDAAKLRRGEGGKAATRTRAKPLILTPEDVADLRRRVIYRDDDVIVLDKPAGLAVQGGTATHRHLDGMLDALTFRAAERPRLVHRLDKDTSGVLVLARNREAARTLTGAFRSRETRKLYLCVTAGCPKPRRGQVSLALAKGMPLTGRTHQLRAHMAAIGTPVLGDGKYGGSKAFISGQGLEQRLHLHARTIEIPKPGGGILRATAPLPPHLETALAGFAFEIPDNEDTFPRD
jgi:23S rRNA pseudouridine955/2504/2580 synthase